MRSVLDSKSKKGQLGNLQSIITTLIIVGILLGIAFLVLEEFMDQMDTGSEAEAGVNATIQAMTTITTWLSIIVILAIVGILLAIVFSVLPRSGTGA